MGSGNNEYLRPEPTSQEKINPADVIRECKNIVLAVNNFISTMGEDDGRYRNLRISSSADFVRFLIDHRNDPLVDKKLISQLQRLRVLTTFCTNIERGLSADQQNLFRLFSDMRELTRAVEACDKATKSVNKQKKQQRPRSRHNVR